MDVESGCGVDVESGKWRGSGSHTFYGIADYSAALPQKLKKQALKSTHENEDHLV